MLRRYRGRVNGLLGYDGFVRLAALLVSLAACGRFGFDGVNGDAGSDSADARVPSCTPVCLSSTMLDSCAGIVQCPNGCEAGPPAGCTSVAFTPSNGIDPTVADDPALQATFLDPGETAIVNTDTGEIIINGTEYRAAGPGVINGIYYEQSGTSGVFAALSGNYPAGSTIRAFGTRSFVLVAKQDLALGGRIDVSAGMCATTGSLEARCGGPNGGRGGSPTASPTGCGPGGAGNGGSHPGGGGGAFGTAGAAGGSTISAGGEAGVTSACPSDLTVSLVGGSGGGVSDAGGAGGGGGGAMQLVVFGAFTGDDVIVASGAGGRASNGPIGGGGGGGSGGAILIEAGAIVFSGVLAANGGAGGEGDGNNPGESGQAGVNPATCAVGLGNIGGNGGAVGSPPGIGTSATEDAGGGGGSVGRIHLRSNAIDLTGAISSPAASTSTL